MKINNYKCKDCVDCSITIMLNFAIYLSLAFAIIFLATDIFRIIMDSDTKDIVIKSHETIDIFSGALTKKIILTNATDKLEMLNGNLSLSENSFHLEIYGIINSNKNKGLNGVSATLNIPEEKLKDNNHEISPARLVLEGIPRNLNETVKNIFVDDIKFYVIKKNDLNESESVIKRKKKFKDKLKEHHKYTEKIIIASEDISSRLKITNSQIRSSFLESSDLNKFQKCKLLWPLITDDNNILRTSPLFLLITITLATLGIFFSTYMKKKVELMYQCKKTCFLRNILLILIILASSILVFYLTYYYLDMTSTDLLTLIEDYDKLKEISATRIDKVSKDIYMFIGPFMFFMILLILKELMVKLLKSPDYSITINKRSSIVYGTDNIPNTYPNVTRLRHYQSGIQKKTKPCCCTKDRRNP
jgi:hypothetical protein